MLNWILRCPNFQDEHDRVMEKWTAKMTREGKMSGILAAQARVAQLKGKWGQKWGLPGGKTNLSTLKFIKWPNNNNDCEQCLYLLNKLNLAGTPNKFQLQRHKVVCVLTSPQYLLFNWILRTKTNSAVTEKLHCAAATTLALGGTLLVRAGLIPVWRKPTVLVVWIRHFICPIRTLPLFELL